jgi:phage repressor protein C with HTH and peptisase S24 domain
MHSKLDMILMPDAAAAAAAEAKEPTTTDSSEGGQSKASVATEQPSELEPEKKAGEETTVTEAAKEHSLKDATTEDVPKPKKPAVKYVKVFHMAGGRQ